MTAARERPLPQHSVDPAGPPIEPIDYQHDGVSLRGYLCRPAGAIAAPGILIGHDAMGVGEQTRASAQALARLGHVAFAYDLLGAEAFPVEEALRRHRAIADTPGLMQARAAAALDVLRAQDGVDRDRLAAIGYCQGGIVAMELARARAPIRAAIGFHPGFERPQGSGEGAIAARVLMFVGDRDTIAPPAARAGFAAEMDAKGAAWEMILFGGVTHSFTRPDIGRFGEDLFRYDAFADRRSWRTALDLLDDVFTD